ncbi:hypothetical protein [Fervidibacter sacchari]|nr:hypothetical protein [Candidatus Fervidibacter sacchari]WKU17698.1 hypothetical protein Q2T83_07720 [Candidatus Fervidibacter sacchari]
MKGGTMGGETTKPQDHETTGQKDCKTTRPLDKTKNESEWRIASGTL